MGLVIVMERCCFCDKEPVTRCYSCGDLVCEEHGGATETCPNCNTGYVARDPRHDRISAKPMSKTEASAWWRAQRAEEYQPPACYHCQGLSRARCRNCESYYCAEHAGPNGLCKECGRSVNLGLYIIGAMFTMMGVYLLLHKIFG